MKKLVVSPQMLTLIGMFTALLAVVSQVTIPLPSGVPVTMQTFGVALCGYTLGARRGTAAVAVYLLLGTVGLPVFSGFSGGVAALVGPTGGFLLGFLALAALSGLSSPWLGAAGLLACHTLGVIVFALVTGTPLPRAALVASVPYLIKDAVCVASAYYVARAVTRGLRVARLLSR